MALNFDLVIIGGGAAGLMAAIAAAGELKEGGQNKKIAVLESNARIGKKLLATGNGRCNLTNMDVGPAHYHGDVTCLPKILDAYSPQSIIDVFASLGLLCKEQDEGRVYPYNAQASAVLDVLRLQLDHFGVEVFCDSPVTSVSKKNSGFEVVSAEKKIGAKRILFTTGGMAYPQLGANGSGYDILRSLGHSCTELFPALVQLKTDPRRAKPIRGARSVAAATLLAHGYPVKTVSGEVQFTEQGLSGICIFELSSLICELKDKRNIQISLDLMPEHSVRQIFSILKHRSEIFQKLPTHELLNGCLNKLVGPEVIKTVLPGAPKYAGELKTDELAVIADGAKQFCFDIVGTLQWKDAQITAGGVPLKEVDATMQSKFCPGLYLAGELLNINGDCGGFNLHWAWSTGLLVGRSAARSLMR